MPPSRILLACGLMLSVAGAGCTTSGPDMGAVLAVAPGEVPVLPDTVTVVPEASEAMLPLAAESTPPEGTGTLPEVAGDKARAAAAPATGAPAPRPVASEVAVSPAALPVVAYAAPRPSGFEGRSEVDRLIVHYADVYGVPVELVRRVVKRESNFRPEAYNKGHWGLMQIKHATARGMGYPGPASGLLDAETNLRYAVKYLRGAWLVAGGNHDQAVRFYARGYYYDAKRAGLLDETGLGKDRVRRRRPG